MDKSLLSSLVAAAIVVAGLLLEQPYADFVLNTGLFALSGALTNWLAIHMLFERVPGFYGSGVIPLRFEEFKLAIREMLMEQFFSEANLDDFFGDEDDLTQKLEQKIKESIEGLDLSEAFEQLIEVIMASSFGGMLGMLGGRDALTPLKEPFVVKMKEYFKTYFGGESFKASLEQGLKSVVQNDSIREKLEQAIDRRLQQMTPQLVKEIIQKMIKKHLGWLVVWGAVFGGAIGLLVSIATNL